MEHPMSDALASMIMDDARAITRLQGDRHPLVFLATLGQVAAAVLGTMEVSDTERTLYLDEWIGVVRKNIEAIING